MSKFYLYLSRYATVLFLLLTCQAYAQTTVSGRVTAADDGSGLPGVNVLEKGTQNGTVTNADGSYTITVGSNATLVFSFVGYITSEVAVGTQSTIDIALQSDVTALTEVVVVGYGTQEKKEITSAVTSVGSAIRRKFPAMTASMTSKMNSHRPGPATWVISSFGTDA